MSGGSLNDMYQQMEMMRRSGHWIEFSHFARRNVWDGINVIKSKRVMQGT